MFQFDGAGNIVNPTNEDTNKEVVEQFAFTESSSYPLWVKILVVVLVVVGGIAIYKHFRKSQSAEGFMQPPESGGVGDVVTMNQSSSNDGTAGFRFY